MKAHWGVPDPLLVEGNPAEKALRVAEIYKMLETRIGLFVNLRMDALDALAMQKHLDAIGNG